MSRGAAQRQPTAFTALDPMADALAPWRAAATIAPIAARPPGPGTVVLTALDTDQALREALVCDGRTLCALAADPRQASRILRLGARRATLLSLCIDTRAAMALDLAHAVRGALERAAGIHGVAAADFEACLHEAVSNALIHGNLGVGSALRQTVETCGEFSALIEERLADPGYGGRLLCLRIARIGCALLVTVGDEGAGMPHGVPKITLEQAQAKATGRGLALIRSLTEDLRHRDGGRLCVMRIRRAA